MSASAHGASIMNYIHFRNALQINFKLCLLEIFSNKIRTFITSFGIFLGVASLLANLAFVKGMDRDIQKNLETIGGLNMIQVSSKRAETPEEKLQFRFSPGLTLRDGYELEKRSRFVKAFLIEVDQSWNRVKSAGKNTWSRVKAVGPEHLEAFNYVLDAGRAFEPADFNERKRVGIIGIRTAQRLWGKETSAADMVGREINVKGMPFTVIGIIKTESEWERRAGEFLYPFPVYQTKYGGMNASVRDINIMITSSDQIDEAEQDIYNQMKALHRGVEDFELEIAIDKINEQKKTQFALKLILMVIAGISLLAGGVSIMNIMFATIGDRIREIGIRKALGAQRSDIFIQFLIEAMLISFSGGFLGMFLGGVITFLPEKTFPFKPMLGPWDYGVAFCFTIMIGVFAGLFPSLKAAKMQPVEALQY